MDDPDHEHETPEQLWLYAKKDFRLLLDRLRRLPVGSRAKLQSSFAQKLVDETLVIDTPAGSLSFVLLGKTAGGRATSLLRKQPATIEWIDSFRPSSVFWDVGANIGVYTLYAALRGARVVAFEPAAVNYFLLAANCEANGMSGHVDCLPLGLGGTKAITRFEVSQFESAKSFSSSGTDTGQGRGRQAALILSIDQLIEEYELVCPNYIKIDAPGMTEAIVSGGARTLQRPDVRELHIEIREHSKAGQRIVEGLARSGLVVASRHEHTEGGSADVTFRRPD